MVRSARSDSLWQPRWASWLVAAFVLLFITVFLYLVYAKLRNYDVLIFDLVDFQRIWSEIKDYASGRSPAVPVLAPLLMQPVLIGPYLFNALWPSNLWAAGMTTLFAGLSIFAFYLLVRQLTQNSWWALLMAFSFAWHPILQQNAMLGFQPGPYLMFFFFLELLYLARGRMRPFLIFLVLTNLSRSSAPVINVLMGCALLFSPATRKFGMRAIIVSGVWIVAMVGMLQLSLHLSGLTFDSDMLHLNAYGATPIEAVTNVIADPKLLIRNVFISDNWHHILQGTPVLFLPLLAPVILVGAAVDLAYVLFTSVSLAEVAWMRNLKEAVGDRVFFHNNMAMVLMVLYGSAAFGLRRFLDLFNGRRGWTIAVGVLLATVCVWHHWAHASVNAGPILCSRGFNWQYYEKSEHAQIVDEAWKQVPDGAQIKGMVHLFGLQGQRMEHFYPFFFPPEGQVFQWVLVDLYSFSYMKERSQTLEEIRSYVEMEKFGVVFFKDGVLLLKRGYPRDRNPEVLAFMQKNAVSLARNLLNPYVLGSRPGARYSATQLVD